MDKNFFIKNKKKIIIVIIVLAISLIGFSLLNSTYSLFYHEDIASNSDNYSTGLLSITATGKGDSISLTNTLPMSDTEGAATTAYTFTIKNIGNLDYKFNVKLLSTGDSSTTIDSQYIKVKVDNDPVTTLSSLSNSIIKNNITLSAGQSIDISIRVWLSSNTPNTQIGKVFNSKIVTDGQAVYTSTNKSVYDYWTGAAKTIADLYTNSTKTPVINNNITYQYDTTNNLMADVAGNIRYYGKSNTTTVPAWQSDATKGFGTYDSESACLEDFETNYNICSPDVEGYANYGYSDQATCEAEYDWGANLGEESMTYNEGKQKYCTGTGKHYEPVEINNYIYFNCSDYSNQSSSTCETWRIIGVFDGKVKIMRGSVIGSYSWDSSASSTNSGTGVNEWSQADLMKLLNSGYDSESVGGSLYWNAKSGTCYSNNNNKTKACDFTSTGLKNDTTRNMIAETTYYTRGYDNNQIFVDAMYDKERVSGAVISPTRTLTWTGKVAIPYPSDYGYAADLSLCQKQLGYYYNATCTANNWMLNIVTNNGGNLGWLLTPNSNGPGIAWYVDSSGRVDTSDFAYLAFGVSPVLYLDSKLVIGSGSGSSSAPYQLTVNG